MAKPVVELVTGICRVSVTVAVVGRKVTVMVQAVAGARVLQLLMVVKLGVELLGVPICRVAAPVLVRRMFCWVAVRPGTLLKMRAVGLRARPGSGEAKPVRAAVIGPYEPGTVRVPVRLPVAVGAKTTLKKQEALGARGPLQGEPPVGMLLRVKSPVSVGAVRVTVTEVRLVTVKRMGALALLAGTVPKFCVVGLSRTPDRAMPAPVRVMVEGLPEEARVTAAV